MTRTNDERAAETGTTNPVALTYHIDHGPFDPRLYRREARISVARQYAVAFVLGKISFARCARVLRGTRKHEQEDR